jgi:hypothetical protein
VPFTLANEGRIVYLCGGQKAMKKKENEKKAERLFLFFFFSFYYNVEIDQVSGQVSGQVP